MKKTICLISLGCPKNLVDSEKILGDLVNNGFIITAEPKDADYIIINTCAFIQPAVKESLDVINEIKKIKKKTDCKIIVFGCLSKLYRDSLSRDKDIDAVVHPDNLYQISSILKSLDFNKSYQKYISAINEFNYQLKKRPRVILTYPYAYLKITEGCNHGCSYCLIPKIRGPHKSYPEKEIIKEAKNLADFGIKEIILVGHDITSYGIDNGKKDYLPQIIEKLLPMNFKWIRLLYLRTEKISEKLIELISNNQKMCKYLDIPLQHIHPDILKKMNRPVIDYEKIIEKLRKYIPGICLRTTFIVGFPGETKKHYQFLMDFVKKIKFDRMGAFPYYREKQTSAYNLPHQVPEKEKIERLNKIMSIQKDILKNKLKKLIGENVEVLIDKKTKNQLIGRTQCDAPDIDCEVQITGNAKIGDIVNVKITKTSAYTLTGIINKK
jgi:ribosomal protein S12 methylthiotransferase